MGGWSGAGEKYQTAAGGMSNACPHVETGCGKSTKGTSGRTSSGTTGIMDYAKKSDAKEFIIGTENSIVQHLQFACPDKQFYLLSKGLICPDMRMTTLTDVYHAMLGQGGQEICLDEGVRLKAKHAIDEMIRLGR